MDERETQAQGGAGGRAFARARWLLLGGASAALVALAVVAVTSGDGASARASRAADVPVTASGISFSPSTVRITPGETVTWNNTGGTHDVVFPDGFRQPPQPANPGNAWPVSRRFDTTGTFNYFCSVHQGQGMVGTVIVEATPPPGTPPPGGGTPPPGGGTPPPGGGGTPPPGGGGTPPPGGGGGGGDPGGGGGGGGSPGGRVDTTVTLKVSDASPARGARVRFFGTVQPERDGRMLQLQRRRGRSYVTVTRIRLTDAGSTRSKFSKRLRIVGDAVFRARLPADSDHLTGVSRTKRLNVP
jgi:plastocyanin